MVDATTPEQDRYVALLKQSLERCGARHGRQRLAVYQAAREALDKAMDGFDPPVSDRRRAAEKRKLTNAIRAIEAEMRNQRAPEPEHDLAGAVESSLTDLTVPDEAPGPDRDAPVPAFEFLPPPPPPRRRRTSLARVNELAKERADILQALIIRQIRRAASVDRTYFVWMVVEPVFQIGFVVFAYWMMNHEYILDIYAAPFAAVGVSGWLMFRTVVRTLMSIGARTVRAQFSRVSRFDEIIAQALFVGVLYLTVLSVVLTALYQAGYTFEINNVVAFLAWWCIIWLGAVGVGTGLSALAVDHPWLRRAVPVTMRILMMFSGMVLVTEQLPPDFKAYFLWNPICHALQLLRSALFAQYVSVDAEPTYVLFAVLAALVLGLSAERHSRIQSAAG